MAKKKSNKPKVSRPLVPRFGIGEWYGRSFVNLDEHDRRSMADIAYAHVAEGIDPRLQCPFKGGACTKKGGICSLRLYRHTTNGEAEMVADDVGDLRPTCPNRLKNKSVYAEVAKIVLDTDNAYITDEVRFLQRDIPSDLEIALMEDEPKDDEQKEDVGNIDNVLVDKVNFRNWCALEIQTVYFSGKKMAHLFKHIANFPTGALPFPDLPRRPDYRSSGPKRLMPQLQIKVPSLRRWGKKMAVLVDEAWFRTNVVNVPTEKHISNADIVWCVVRIIEDTDPPSFEIVGPWLQTLENAVAGLTGGYPVPLPVFEQRLLDKLDSKKPKSVEDISAT